jgi:hypothetical protein
MAALRAEVAALPEPGAAPAAVPPAPAAGGEAAPAAPAPAPVIIM